jgi:SAM-dependent methyltransferase
MITKNKSENNWSSFDYSKIEDIAEVKIRMSILYKRLKEISINSDNKILEVGIGSGDITLMLLQQFLHIVSVDPDEENINLVVTRIKKLNLRSPRFVISKIEDADLGTEIFDKIILFGILEHLADPPKVLNKLALHLNKSGRIYIVVNLANSIHRLLGVKIGLIKNVDELSESDIVLGHYRIYNVELLKEHIKLANLKMVYELPFYLKPLPTRYMNNFPLSIHEGLDLLGRELKEFASYFYAEVAHK